MAAVPGASRAVHEDTALRIRPGSCASRPWRRWTLAVLAALGGAAPAAAQLGGPPFPRLANMYLHGAVNPAEIPQLARWDVLILDSIWTDEQLRSLRALNPNIKLYFYVCAYCVPQTPIAGDTWRTENRDYAARNDLWWYNWNRTIASDWPGTQLANITERGPAGPEGTWREYITERVATLVASQPQLDGVFYDNFWRSIAWEQGGVIQVDSDCNPTHNPAGCDGVMDSPAEIDTLWNRALRRLAGDTRSRFDALEPGRARPLTIVTNSSTDYFSWLNGTLYEYFPSGNANPDPGNPYGYNWNQEMLAVPGGYLVAPFRSTPYRVSVLNADWEGTWAAPTRSLEFERHKRFTLCSSLLGDGYYSLDAAQTGHGSIWWEPEYDHAGRGKGYLGYPMGPMRRIGVPSGAERIANGGFDAGTTPWETLAWNADGDFALDATNFHSAPAAGRVTLRSAAEGGSFKLYQNVAVESGRSYTLRFWARASTPQELLLHLYSTSCPGIRCLTDQRAALATSWTQHELSFTSTGTAQAGLNLFVTAPGTVWLDDLSLREGDTAVYRRDFDNGVVLLNYTTTAQSVDLGEPLDRLSIPGSSVFDGARVTVETVPPSDGRILLRATDPGPQPSPPPPAPRSTLEQNEPNPFNPSTRIRFRLGRDEHVHLAIYDGAGRLVRTLLDRTMAGGGESSVRWDGTDRFNRRVRSGIYYYRITTPSFTESRKMTLLM